MPETIIGANESARQEMTIDPAQLAGSMFGVEVPKKEEATTTPTTTVVETKQEAAPAQEVKSEEKVEAANWIKDFGWENEQQAQEEIKQLRGLKDKQPQDPFIFTNEESKKVFDLLREGKIDDVVQIYNQQKQFDSLLSAEVNADNAADIIKASMKIKYPSLTDAQIDFQYRQEYGIPKEPKQALEESDEDFAERMAEYNERVENVKMKATIAATMAKPDIENAKKQIVLPEINGVPQLTQEELAKQKQYAEQFLNSIQESVKSFNGFSEVVKHEGVDFTINYGIAEDEKAAISAKLNEFVEKGYDANALLAPRWVNEDGTLKSEQMVKDLLLLDNADKAFKKFSNEAAAKALESYIKGKKNINIIPKGSQQVVELEEKGKTVEDKVRDAFFG